MDFDRFSLAVNETHQLVSLVALTFELHFDGSAFEVTVNDYPDEKGNYMAAWSPRDCAECTNVETLKSLDRLGELDLQKLTQSIADQEKVTGTPEIRHLRRNLISLKENVEKTLNKGPIIVSDKMFRVDNVQSAVLVADLRNFSSWLSEATEEDRSTFFQGFADIISYIIQDFGCSFYKLLGDGVLMIWDEDDLKDPQSPLEVAFTIHSFFQNIAAMVVRPVEGFGIAVTSGSLIRFVLPSSQSTLCIKDYMGEAINHAARFQGLAKAGEVVADGNFLRSIETLDQEIYFDFETRKITRELKGIKTDQVQLYTVTMKNQEV